jgi:hypothetical protein
MDDEDTARSGFVDQDLSEVSAVNVPSDDPIDWFDPEEADVSISNKGEILNFLTLPCSSYKSQLCWLRSTW